VSGPRPAPEPDRWPTPEEAADTDCVFHGKIYPEHDFYYGSECRRCGAEADEDDIADDVPNRMQRNLGF
jgi:hypothetical protein